MADQTFIADSYAGFAVAKYIEQQEVGKYV